MFRVILNFFLGPRVSEKSYKSDRHGVRLGNRRGIDMEPNEPYAMDIDPLRFKKEKLLDELAKSETRDDQDK